MTSVEQTSRPPVGELRHAFRSMASDVRIWVVAPRPGADALVREAQGVVEAVARSCTRFDPTSDLMLANAGGRHAVAVSRECFDALREAHAAHVLTDGLFDPRVLTALTAIGYDRSLPFESRPVVDVTGRPPRRHRRPRPWNPVLDEEALTVRVGREPVDLGGIGKGLAVRWASERLRDAGDAVLVEAGGDLMAFGAGPEGEGWMVDVENPFRAADDPQRDPVAVLRVEDRGVATSSTRIRSWTAGGRQVHHLVDPRTRRPATSDLASVTVVHADPATAEVWSKSLFVLGRGDIRAAADVRGLAALWVDTTGHVGVSRTMRPHVAWQVSRAS